MESMPRICRKVERGLAVQKINHFKNNFMDKKTLLIGEVDAQQIEAWKKKYPLGIFAVKKDGRIAYFKNPDFKDIDFYHAQASKSESSVSDGWKVLAEVLYIGGDKELTESPKYLPTISKRLQEAVAGDDAELVNL